MRFARKRTREQSEWLLRRQRRPDRAARRQERAFDPCNAACRGARGRARGEGGARSGNAHGLTRPFASHPPTKHTLRAHLDGSSTWLPHWLKAILKVDLSDRMWRH